MFIEWDSWWSCTALTRVVIVRKRGAHNLCLLLLKACKWSWTTANGIAIDKLFFRLYKKNFLSLHLTNVRQYQRNSWIAGRHTCAKPMSFVIPSLSVDDRECGLRRTIILSWHTQLPFCTTFKNTQLKLDQVREK